MHEPNFNSDRIAVIGISPRNGFFSQENITLLVKRILDEYPRAVTMIADVPATANWVAFGYSPEKAWAKARLDGNNYRHRVERARENGGFGLDRLSIPVWGNNIEPRTEYHGNRQKIQAIYETNQGFRTAARETTEHFLGNAQKGWNDGAHAISDIKKAVDGAVHYLLSELAFIESAPMLFNAKNIDYVYHHKFEIYDNYRNGVFDGVPRPQLGMKIFA